MTAYRYTIILLLFLMACGKGQNPVPDPEPDLGPLPVPEFVKGADVSWVTEMEDSSRLFYNGAGEETDLFELMNSLGMNVIRLRVWVNPAKGYNNIDDVVKKAKRAADAGMYLMIDFHYSDTWADPGRQIRPQSWNTLGFEALRQSLEAHTLAVLNRLNQDSIPVGWVQIGNETNDGMLWPLGRASDNMNNFATLLNTGYNAVKSVYPDAKVIVHLSNGYDNVLYSWMFDALTARRVMFDVIGMSLYVTPGNWEALSRQCLFNMNEMVARYGKEVMIVECGMPWNEPELAYRFLSDLIQKVKSVTDGKGKGVLYWEPEAYGNWNGYTLGAFDDTGKPTEALSAFSDE
ncbi:MAG: glycosyl hydrolase 53 family protein [Chitinophagaceae bacterium]|nr:glycosyl hydrolase 53 family protein [Chitinophagaceae bacterium]